MPKPIHRLTTTVSRIDQAARDVRVYELADPDGWELPPFTAGAHVDVHLPSGAVRQYSLCGDPADRSRYRIAVSREEGGRGGSLHFHRDVVEGTTLLTSLPRNLFPLADAPRHLMIAGGIGITPFMAMIAELGRSGGAFDLHYCARLPETAAFREELAGLAGGGAHFHFSRGDRPARLELAELLEDVGEDTHVYCCGPAGMMEEVHRIAGDRLAGRLHTETFGAATGADKAFEVELARSGMTVDVPQGQTILHALRAAGVELNASCEAGVCLECKTRFLAGVPVHRDLLMSAEERRLFMTPCVSGCESPKLVLDI